MGGGSVEDTEKNTIGRTSATLSREMIVMILFTIAAGLIVTIDCLLYVVMTSYTRQSRQIAHQLTGYVAAGKSLLDVPATEKHSHFPYMLCSIGCVEGHLLRQ